jgi:hypothetical protein
MVMQKEPLENDRASTEVSTRQGAHVLPVDNVMPTSQEVSLWFIARQASRLAWPMWTEFLLVSEVGQMHGGLGMSHLQEQPMQQSATMVSTNTAVHVQGSMPR